MDVRTIEEAIAALIPATRENPALAPALEFLRDLEKIVEPAVVGSDYDGFILEGAMQHGFVHIDDNAELFAVSANNLIKFIKLRESK